MTFLADLELRQLRDLQLSESSPIHDAQHPGHREAVLDPRQFNSIQDDAMLAVSSGSFIGEPLGPANNWGREYIDRDALPNDLHRHLRYIASTLAEQPPGDVYAENIVDNTSSFVRYLSGEETILDYNQLQAFLAKYVRTYITDLKEKGAAAMQDVIKKVISVTTNVAAMQDVIKKVISVTTSQAPAIDPRQTIVNAAELAFLLKPALRSAYMIY